MLAMCFLFICCHLHILTKVQHTAFLCIHTLNVLELLEQEIQAYKITLKAYLLSYQIYLRYLQLNTMNFLPRKHYYYLASILRLLKQWEALDFRYLLHFRTFSCISIIKKCKVSASEL